MVNIVFEIYKQHKGLCILCYKILFGKLTYGIFKSTGQAIKNFEQEVILPKNTNLQHFNAAFNQKLSG